MTPAATGDRRPATDWQFNGVVRLTKTGTTFVIFTVIIGFAAINTGNNSLYIGLAFMLGCLLLSGVASKGGLKHLRVDFDRIGEAWAGRPAEGTISIKNASRIWNVRDVIVVSNEIDTPMFVPIIMRRAEVKAPAAFLFARRGIVQLKTLDLYTRYPFGFFLKKRRVKISGEVVVFPRLLDDDTARERFRSVQGDQHPTNRPGHGTDIYSFREYVRGDSMRQVYWKKSASIGRWIMKQTEIEAGRAVHVVIDPFKPRGVSDDEFEQMISEAATFIDHAVRRDLEVILTMPRVNLRANNRGQASAMFRALALLEPSHEEVAQAIDRHAVVFGVRVSDAA
jgi:uncharacterized protein (DUF58 family)